MPAGDLTRLLELVDDLLELAQKRYLEIQEETTGIVHALRAARILMPRPESKNKRRGG